MKRLICGLLVCLLLCGCAAGVVQPEKKQFTASFLDLFDTMTVIKGPAESEDTFRELAQSIHDELLACHQLFDIYND